MYKQGNILVNKQGSKVKVLAVCGELVGVSDRIDHNEFGEWVTEKDLVYNGWTLEQEKWEPEPGELYYFLDSFGGILPDFWADNTYRLSINNVHRTEEEALAYKEALIKWASERK